MIKQTYKSKNGIKTTEKQALPFVQPETETLVEAVLSASQVSLAAGASAPSGESGPPPHQVIKLGLDVHLDRYVVVRQIDGGAPQPPQRFSPTQFLEWAKKQTALAQQVYSCYEAGPFGYSSSGRFAVGLLLGTGIFVPGPPQNRATSRALPGRSPDVSQPPLGVTSKLTESRQELSVDALRQAWQDGAAMNESEKQFSFTCAASSTSGRAKKQILMCSLRSLTCLQVQVLPRQWMVGPSSDSRLRLGETLAGASSAVNGRACHRRQAGGGDWPAALANMQAATLREDCRPEIASFSEASEEGLSEPPNPDRKGEGSHD